MIESKVDVTLQEASELLTVGEVRVLEQHFGGSFGVPVVDGGMRPSDMAAGLVYAYSRRGDLAANRTLTSWADVDKMTLRQLNGYFAPDPIEVDEDAPESDSGKDA